MRLLWIMIWGLGAAIAAAGELEVRQAPGLQALSYGGGLEWTLPVDDDCSLYVREYGDRSNPTWVVLHGGWGAEHSYMLDAFAGLEEQFHLVFYDQRGSLRSWRCDVDSISVDRHVRDLEKLRSELNLERLDLVTHSMGAVLAGAYQRRFPDRVGPLVLIAPGLPKLPLDEDEAALYEPLIEGWQASDYSPMGLFNTIGDLLQARPGVQAEIEKHGLDGEELSARERSELWRLKFAAANLYRIDRWPLLRGGGVFYNTPVGQAAAISMEDLAPWDFASKWRRHDHPVTVIVGDHDYVDWQAALSRHWFETDDHVRLVVLDRAGHVLWLDRPRAFREALLGGLHGER
jgi:proline iminopeptidase